MIYVNVYDLDLKKTAILENAYDIVETQEINQVYSLEFKLPSEDTKNEFCQKFWYIRVNNDGQLYRIISAKSETEDTGSITYTCEHVIATLIDDVIFGAETWGNLGVYTEDSIEHVLDKQTTANWVLGTCDFRRQFEYSVENENLLTTLFSIANRLDVPYMWDYDTTSYPWRVSLKAIDETAIPEYYLRAKRNILKSSLESSSEDICTRLYCLGCGEGVNQLTIADVNDGVPYLLASDEKIEKYGLKTKIFADTRYKDAQSLKERGEALLAGYSEEVQSQSFDVADLYGLTNAEIDRASVGKIVKLVEDDTITYITKTKRQLDEDGNLEITLSTKADDIASTIADLSDRQRINDVYSQGATQIFSYTMNENADSTHGAIVPVYIPDDMKIINEIKAYITFEQFRAYSKSLTSTDDERESSSYAGGSYTTTESGGGQSSTSTSSGGSINISQTLTSSSQSTTSGNTAIYFALNSMNTQTGSTDGHTHRYTLVTSANSTSHTHSVTVPAHSHSLQYSGGSHSHTFSVNAHSHNVSIPSHTHTIKIPGHSHEIGYGIYETGSPSYADVYISGTKKTTIESSGEIDLTQILIDESTGKIPRGQWVEIEIRPNDLAYIRANVFVRGFITSLVGDTY